MNPLRILLADDHALVRAGIRSLLERMPMVEVVAEASNGREAVELIAQTQPDLVLMDVAMPLLNGLDAVALVTKNFPAVHVIVLSMHSSEEFVVDALRCGASGYLLKDSASEELQLAVRTVAAGGKYFSAHFSRDTIASYMARIRANEPPRGALTPRQLEIIKLIADGKCTKEAASLLGISPKTVEAHRIQIMERLGIHDVPGLVRYAIRRGLISAER